MTTAHPARPLAVFAALAALIWAMGFWLVRSAHFAAHPDLFAAALSVDLTVTVAVIWLAVVVRSGAASVTSAIPVFLLGLLGAHVLLPADHRGALGLFEVVAVGAEGVLLIMAAAKLRRTVAGARERLAEGRPWLDAVESAIGDSLGTGLATRLVASEVAMFRYAVVGWFEKAPTDGFSVWRKAGWPALVAVFAFLVVLESVVVHVFVERWSVALAWVLTAGSVYTLAWLLGDWNALRLEPVRVAASGITVTVGLRWRVEIPWARIVRIEACSHLEEVDGHLDAAVSGAPTVAITVDDALLARGPFGITRPFTRIGLSIDDVPGFLSATARA